MNQRYRAFPAITACVLFWGISFVSIKITMTVFPPMTLGAFRFAIATVFLFFIKKRYAPAEKLKVRDLPLLVAAGLIGVTLYFFCENNGVARITASEASLISAFIPVLTMLAEWFGGWFAFIRRKGTPQSPPPRIAPRRWLGAIISVAGVWLIAGVSIGGEKSGGNSGSALGYLFMSGAPVSWVAYAFLTKRLFARCSQTYITFWQTLFGFIAFVPFAAAEFPAWGIPNAAVLCHLLFLGVACSALGYWFYVIALETLGVAIPALFLNFVPVVTVAAGFLILGERLVRLQWLGAALVLAGISLAAAMYPASPDPPLDGGDEQRKNKKHERCGNENEKRMADVDVEHAASYGDGKTQGPKVIEAG
ncbi:MAG: DMT family transporter [Treponema sp.]|jgi:drug/metabolite transporter (DMT)-like permease|nr:DMT family transporter [Treponema sp.]